VQVLLVMHLSVQLALRLLLLLLQPPRKHVRPLLLLLA
jgi:hypothetical protein